MKHFPGSDVEAPVHTSHPDSNKQFEFSDDNTVDIMVLKFGDNDAVYCPLEVNIFLVCY